MLHNTLVKLPLVHRAPKVTELTQYKLPLFVGWTGCLVCRSIQPTPLANPSFRWGTHHFVWWSTHLLPMSFIKHNALTYVASYLLGGVVPWHNVCPRNPNFPIYEDFCLLIHGQTYHNSSSCVLPR
jgi:hypothetical protein